MSERRPASLVPTLTLLLLAAPSLSLALDADRVDVDTTLQRPQAPPKAQEKAAPELTEEQQQARAKNARGVELAEQGDIDAAIAVFLEALALDPELAGAHYNLGVAYGASEDWERAEAAYAEASRLRVYPEAHYQLGEMFFAQGRVPEAARELETAVVQDPGFTAAWFSLGNLRASQQQLALAIEAYQRASELAPESSQTHFRLAVVFYGAGLYPNAWEHVHAAQDLGLEVNPRFLEALAEQMPEPPRQQ